MQILDLKRIPLPTIQTTKVDKDLLPQEKLLLDFYLKNVPERRHEELSELVHKLALHCTHSKHHPEAYKKNTLYFLWFLFTDTAIIKEFYIPEKNTFSRFFSTGMVKKKDDSFARLIEYLEKFYSTNKTLSQKEKQVLTLYINGFTSSQISNTLKLTRADVTYIIKTLVSRALKYLDVFYQTSQTEVNNELQELSNIIWEDEEEETS